MILWILVVHVLIHKHYRVALSVCWEGGGCGGAYFQALHNIYGVYGLALHEGWIMSHFEK